MQLEENKIYEVLKKIEIRIQGQTISKEKLLKSFGQYLSQTFSKRDHNIGLIMHTGSVCFDAMLVTYAMIFNLISNKVETGDVVNSFSEGDIVLYGQNKKSRYFFGGFVDGSEIRAEIGKKYIKLTQGGTSVNYIPEKSWRNIEPYNGDSVRMDGRGIRKKSSLRDDFFVEVLGFTKENIPSVLDTSCVIVAPRDRVDYLVKNISLAFGKKKISLLELVTASYFTEEDEYRYFKNKSTHNRINQLQKKSTLIVTMQEQGEAITSEEKETEDFEKEMEEYIFNADITSVNSEYRSNTGCEGMVNTAIAVVTAFDDDTKAYLSKHYKAYVLDETIGVVKVSLRVSLKRTVIMVLSRKKFLQHVENSRVWRRMQLFL